MKDDLKDILSNLNKDIEQQKLLEYLNRNMPDAAQHEFEKQMNDDAFVNDAIEGLQQMDTKNILLLIQELNDNLKKQVEKKKKRKQKRKLQEYPWIYFTLILLLLLIIISFIVIRNFIK